MKKSLLQIMMKTILEEYQACHQDRHRLHKLEWEHQESEPSILGEVEVRVDIIIGLVKTYLELGIKDKEKTVTLLKDYSIYHSPILLKWLVEEGANFSNFALYMTHIEHLRMFFLEMINEN